MEDDIRLLLSQTGSSNKIHNILVDISDESNEASRPNEQVTTLQNQIKENQKAIQKVIEGLA